MTSRRTFLARIGLASPLALGIGNTLIGRALGQTNRRKMALFFVHGEAWIRYQADGGYTPPGITPLAMADDGGHRALPGQDVDQTNVQWPEFFGALAPFRDKSVIVDSLYMSGVSTQNSLHGWKYGALSVTGAAESPSGISIDQHVAGVLGRDTPIKSLLIGGGPTFASGPGASLSGLVTSSAFYARLVGGGAGSATGAPRTVLGTRLMDLLREDLRRLDRGLAAEEKARLGEYLSSMESFQKKEQGLAAQFQQPGCSVPAVLASTGTIAQYQANFRMATLALKCGVTNVIGVTMGNTGSHDDFRSFDAKYQGHVGYTPWMRAFAPISMGWVAEMLRDLGPLAANMTVTIVPANGIAHGSIHHGNSNMAALVYDGSGALRTGARFLRTRRPLADLYTTLAQTLGAPVEKFNGGGTGRINELLA